MPSRPCASEKAAWTAAGKKFRDNEAKIRNLDGQIARTIALMRRARRPPAELDWAMAIAQASNGAEVRDKNNQRMALLFEANGNARASSLRSMAAKRGDAIEQRPKLDSDRTTTEQLYRECVEALVVVSRECGQPRTGHGHEGEPCQVALGADGSCQYHGTSVA